MKCPYRPITTTTDNSTTTEFAECYYNECPWYLPERTIKSNGLIQLETCQRCHTENTQANNERERYRR